MYVPVRMMIKKIFYKFLSILNKREIIREDGKKYLTRYYIFRKPVRWMPSIYIHHFHSGDSDLELHNHEWKISASLILSGSYVEERRDSDDKIKTKIVSPGSLNIIKDSTFHRVDLITPEVWTLFISGHKGKPSWGFWDRHTGKFTQWEEFLNRKAQTQMKIAV